MSGTTLHRDYNAVIRRARANPGVAEMMEAYGRYDEIVQKSNEYLNPVPSASIWHSSRSS